jgi:hypothetical protein
MTKVFEPLTKKELYERAGRFTADENRHITLKLFLELAGISNATWHDVFISRKLPMTTKTQIKVSRAFRLLENGEVAAKRVNSIMPNQLVFLKKPVYRAGRAVLLQYNKDSGFTLKPQIVNKNSYNVPQIDLTDK